MSITPTFTLVRGSSVVANMSILIPLSTGTGSPVVEADVIHVHHIEDDLLVDLVLVPKGRRPIVRTVPFSAELFQVKSPFPALLGDCLLYTSPSPRD